MRSVILLTAALLVLATAAPLPRASAGVAGVAERVLIIGIDGLTLDPNCLPGGSMPNLETMMQTSSYTITARTATEAVSGPGWSSLLCAMPPAITGVTSNRWTPPWAGDAQPITPITGADEPFPCIFDVVSAQAPDLHVAAYYDWDWLSYIIQSDALDTEYFCDGYEFGYGECDRRAYMELLADLQSASTTPDVAFIYLGSLDEDGGHHASWCSDTYIEVANLLDTYVGDFLNALDGTGLLNTTAIIVSADHGGAYGTRLHGIPRDDNLNIPFIVRSPGVRYGYEIEGEAVEVVDVSATAVALLGLQGSPWWIGRIPETILE